MKTNCVSCSGPLEMTQERYIKMGNYCPKCSGIIGRMVSNDWREKLDPKEAQKEFEKLREKSTVEDKIIM